MINRILQRFPDIRQHFLLIAEGRTFASPTAVHTVLGSCVSVTFHCQRLGLGAMFHALLPRAADYREKNVSTYRYVDTAVTSLWHRLSVLGVDRNEVQCKILGGANALMNDEYACGQKNALVAFETLAELGLRVVASNVGGRFGRKALFLSHTGEVFVKTLNQQPPRKPGL